jgi:sugar (pentulose or hexulose) kinase
MGGGTTSSDLFMQIHADVSNIAINVPENPQSSCLGSAILAAVTAGFYTSIQEAADNMVRFNKRIEPDFENHKKYREIFKQYQKAYGELGNWMRETSLINK